MKVAYLLVTTAWLTGAQQPGAPAGEGGAPKVQPPPVVTPGPIATPGHVAGGGDCGNNCCDSEGYGHRFREFCGRLFRRNDGCDSCGSGHGGGFLGGAGGCGCGLGGGLCGGHSFLRHDGCGCDEGYGHRFKEFCGRLFRRNECCDSGNNGCCGSGGYGVGGTVIVPKGAEQIPPPKDGPPPKEMPKGPGEPPQKQTQIFRPGQPTPVQTPTFEAPPAGPAAAPASPNQQRPF